MTGSCDIPPQLCRPSSLSSFIAPSRSAYTIGVCPATSDTSRSFPSGNSCDLACADGYQLSASASLLVTCNDGSWSGAPSGTCVPCTSACQKCNAGPAITTGYVLDSCSSSLPYSPQTSCTLACAEGYVVRDTSSTGGGAGTFVTLCDGSTGTFPPITATCVKKESSNSGGGGSNTGAIAGGVIGAIVAIALLAAAVIYRRRKNSGKEFEMK